MKKRLAFALLIAFGLTAFIVNAQQNKEEEKTQNPHKVKVTIVEDQNGEINKSEEIIDVNGHGDVKEYLKSKGVNLEEMEVFKRGGYHHAHRYHHGQNHWVFNRSGESNTHVMVIAETDDEHVEGKVEEKVMVKKIEINDGEGEVENMEVRVEKIVDEDGNVTVKKFVNGEEVEPGKAAGCPHISMKTMEDGGEMEIVVETQDNKEAKTIKIKKEIDEEGNVTVLKSVNGGEFKEVKHGKEGHVKWHQKSDYHSRPMGMAARSKDGSTMVFVTPVDDNGAAQNKTNSLEEQSLKLTDVKFFPNPSDGQFSLSFNSPEEGAVTVTITDLQGRKIMEEKIKSWDGQHEFELNESEAGVYLVKIEQNGQVYSNRLVVR